MKKWYLIYCKQGQLSRAKDNLEIQGVDCFTPMGEIEKVVKGQRKIVSEPLFPNYLFIYFDYELIHTTTIQATRGVSCLIRFGKYPVIVPTSVIDGLSRHSHTLCIASNVPECGAKVTVLEGAFAGIEAIYKEPDGEKRSIILLNILNKSVEKVVDNSVINKIDE